MIRLGEKASYGKLRDADVTVKELMTVFAAAENLIDLRPVAYLSPSIKNDNSFTTDHFFIGQSSEEFAGDNENDTGYHPRNCWHEWKNTSEAWNDSNIKEILI